MSVSPSSISSAISSIPDTPLLNIEALRLCLRLTYDPATMLRSKSRGVGGFREPASYRYWTCGHCGEGLLSLKLDEHCLNASCGRRRDNYSTLYDAAQVYDTPGVSSPSTTLIDHADESQSHKPAARRELSSSVAKTGKPKARYRDGMKNVSEKSMNVFEEIW